jgi:transcription termination factor Rho
MEYDTLEELISAIKRCNMGALRDLARSFSLVPSSRSRAALETMIVDAYLGKIVVEKTGKSGRPALSQTRVEQSLTTEEEDADTLERDDMPSEWEKCGILSIMPDGFGLLYTRSRSDNGKDDIYVSPQQIRRFSLQTGDKIRCTVRTVPDRTTLSLVQVKEINDIDYRDIARRNFDDLTPIYPSQRLNLLMEGGNVAMRMLELVSPIGKGQRGIIIAPPKSGKTLLLKLIAQALAANHPEVFVMLLLVGQRPEEVTDFYDSVSCEVVYSPYSAEPERHASTAQLVIANAKRRVELGQDVVVLLDNFCCLARAYMQLNSKAGANADSSPLVMPKKLFGAAVNTKEGGSLTILATVLADAANRADDCMAGEIRDLANLEIILDNRASKRVCPYIDMAKSYTHRDDFLLTKPELECATTIKRSLDVADKDEVSDELIDLIFATKDNTEFMAALKSVRQK